MRIIGLSDETVHRVLSLVAAVLHLGNIVFVQDEQTDAAILEGPVAQDALEVAARLLGVR